jgi:FixJ family two-component response regulator
VGCSAALVAVVDDDHRVLESLESLLSSAGHAVVGFASAQAFLDSGALELVDVLISDIGMTSVDGLALRALARDRRPDLPVLLVSGRADLIEEARRQNVPGAVMFAKPFQSASLLGAVERELTTRRSSSSREGC